MKRAGFKAHPDRAGWIRTTLCPVNDKHRDTFRIVDIVMFTALVLGVFSVARLLIAH